MGHKRFILEGLVGFPNWPTIKIDFGVILTYRAISLAQKPNFKRRTSSTRYTRIWIATLYKENELNTLERVVN